MQSIEKVLKSLNREEEEQHAQAMANQIGLPYINLVSYPILPDILRLVPEDQAKNHHVIAYLKLENSLRVASSRPADPGVTAMLATLKQVTGLKVELVLCSESSIRYGLQLYATLAAIGAAQDKVSVTAADESGWDKEIHDLASLKQAIVNVPTTKLMDVVFAGALKTRSSDIHLEPTESGMRIRYRIDGVLQEITTLSLEAYKSLRNRIKYLANLKLDVTNIPQDGRFAAEAIGKQLDVRVSLIPGPAGEYIVMRLLTHDQGLLSLDELAIRPDALVTIRDAIHKPHGIIFNTGPTGSGKTTTLYAILSELNKPGVKIITLEDPIEYKIAGINQSQVEPEQGYDFAKGLRSILRQDPDIILVGEIRDAETANTAIQAALTGHLVLTTLHTNSAAGALPRLLDMGVPPFLLAGSVNLIIAQRLVRRICTTCKGTGIDPTKPGAACPRCGGVKYLGRVAIVETLVPNDTINQLIAKKAPVAAFDEAARQSGMVSMQQDGMLKVQQGLTTAEEVARVTQE